MASYREQLDNFNTAKNLCGIGFDTLFSTSYQHVVKYVSKFQRWEATVPTLNPPLRGASRPIMIAQASFYYNKKIYSWVS